MRCSDENFYVVKFQNNPQGRRVLANELLATRLAERAGVPVPIAKVVEVSAWLVENTPELHIEVGGEHQRCHAGLQFGARFVVDPLQGQVFDYLPAEMLVKVANLEDFAGMLCLDKWTCNTNGRQAVFAKRARERKYRATFIDQGYCFNAVEWSFPDAALRGVYARNEVYAEVKGWESFEPYLTRMAEMPAEAIAECADGIPPEWVGDSDDLERVIEELGKRRRKIPELIEAFRKSSRAPFPAWSDAVQVM